MSPQKRRKPMDDAAALGFVFGQSEPESAMPEPIPEPEPEPPAEPEPKPVRSQKAASKTAKPKPEPTTTTEDIMNSLMQTETPERTIRFTVDMPESLHKKLSLLAAKSGRKKSDIVRTVLDSVLKDVSE